MTTMTMVGARMTTKGAGKCRMTGGFNTVFRLRNPCYVLNTMRLCTAIVLSVCIVGGANGQAPDPPVCERSQAVQDEIISEIDGVGNCSQITDISQMASVGSGANAFRIESSALLEGDFNNLPGVKEVAIRFTPASSLPDGLLDDMVNLLVFALGFGSTDELPADLFRNNHQIERVEFDQNNLITLPSGLFDGLDRLRTISLLNNPLQSLPVDIFDGLQLDRLLIDTLVATIGALPEEVVLTAAESSTTIDLRPAFIRSTNVTDAIIQNANAYEITAADTAVATVQLDAHELTIEVAGSGETTVTIVGRRSGQTAMQTIRVMVPLPEPPVCERTPQVRDAIVDAIDGISDCNDANSNLQLAAISNLDFSDSGTTALQSNDFNNLIGLTELDLSENLLQTLPEDIFDQLPETTTRINLQGNPFDDGLPLAVIERLRTVEEVTLDITAVQDVLSTQLALVPGDTMDLDLEDSFIAMGGGSSGPADSYEITTIETSVVETMADTSVAETALNNHILTVTAGTDGQAVITVTGILNDSSATHTITVNVGPQPPVCQRTQRVQTEIVGRATGASDCSEVTSAHLAAIDSISLVRADITELQSGDFAGLTHSGLAITLAQNQMQTLPADIFAGLSPLAIDLQENPFGRGLPSALVDYFRVFSNTLRVDLVSVQDVLPMSPLALTLGTPMTVDLEDAFFYAAGTDTRGNAAAYEINVSTDTVITVPDSLSAGDNHILTITPVGTGQIDIQIVGIREDQKATQTLTVQVTHPEPDPPVCQRTQQVQDAIVDAISGVSDCSDVTGAQLAGIVGTFDLENRSTTELRSGDFNGLTGIVHMRLNGNQLETLPADIFDNFLLPEYSFDGNLFGSFIRIDQNPFRQGLPRALVETLESAGTGDNFGVALDLAAVQDVLMTQLEFTNPSNTQASLDLTEAFIASALTGSFKSNFRSAASYDVTAADSSIATAQINGNTLTLIAGSNGQTEVTIVGRRSDSTASIGSSGEQAATLRLTVTVNFPDDSGSGDGDGGSGSSCRASDLSVDDAAVTVQEGGDSESITVTLSCLAGSSLTVNTDVNPGSNFIDVRPQSLTFNSAGSATLEIVPTIDDNSYTGSPKTAALTLSAAGYDDVAVTVSILEDEVLQIVDVSLKTTEGMSVATIEDNSSYRVTYELAGFPDSIQPSLSVNAVSLADDGDVIALESTRRISSTEIEIGIPELTDRFIELQLEVTSSDFADTDGIETRSYTTVYPVTAEALMDDDNDGVPDEHDVFPEATKIQASGSQATSRAVTVSNGRIVLGEYARRQAAVEDVYQASIDTAVLNDIGIAGQPDNYNGEGIYDFAVYLSAGESSARVAIELVTTLTANNGWAKYNAASGNWEQFAIWEAGSDDIEYGDIYYSVPGSCTPQSPSTGTVTGMVMQGHSCVILLITDGGPNDADGEINGIVVDPGAPGAGADAPAVGGGGGGGGGTADLWLLLLLAMLAFPPIVILRFTCSKQIKNSLTLSSPRTRGTETSQ